MKKDQDIYTRCIHAGEKPDPATKSIPTPIYQSAVYAFDSMKDLIAYHKGREDGAEGYMYSRPVAPTQRVLEKKIASLEEGEDALDYVAGIDGGATKTICIIANTEGKVLGRGVSGSSNYHNVGMSSAKKALLQSIKSAASNAKLGRLRFKVACFGMAGLDSPYDKKIISKFIREEIKFCEKITVVHDSVIALYGATGGAPGLIVEAGTGSFAAGLNKRGEIKRVGGWGNIIGDEGSAYEIGRQALKAFLRSYDGREVKTLLTEKIVKMLKLRVEEDLMQRVYAEKMSISEIAAVAPLVAEAADEGDSVAKRILTEAGRELASYAIAIAKALGMENEDVEVYMTGGVFKAGSHVLKPFEEEIKKIMPKARLASPKFEPAMGAVFLALRELSEKK